MGDPMRGLTRPKITPVRVPANRFRRKGSADVSAPVLSVTYLYRDAGNWKFWGEFRVLGELRLDDLRPHLFEHEFFIPERIGLPSLVPELKNDDDHLLHTFEDLAAVEPAPYVCTAEDLLDRVRLANEQGWFSGIY